MACVSFAREREDVTWEAIQLSLLSPWEILKGKIETILLACSPLMMLLLLPLTTCIRKPYGIGNMGGGVSVSQVLITFALLISTTLCCTICGLAISWRCHRTYTAVGWTLGSLLFLLVLVPVTWASIFPVSLVWHPVVALAALCNSGEANGIAVGMACTAMQTVAGAVVLVGLNNQLSRRLGYKVDRHPSARI
jgi:hypothetical protein